MTTPNKEYNLNLMTNPNTEGTAPTAPPPLATYPLCSGMATPLTAARADHAPLPRGPPTLPRRPSGPKRRALIAAGCRGEAVTACWCVLVPAQIANSTFLF